MYQVTRCRSRAMRRDYLARSVGKRAVHVVILNTPYNLSAFEENALIQLAAYKSTLQKWKSIVVNVSSAGLITFWNAAHYRISPSVSIHALMLGLVKEVFNNG